MEITNARVEIGVRVTFDVDGKEVSTMLYTSDPKTAINRAVQIYRDKNKEKSKKKPSQKDKKEAETDTKV